MRKRFIGSQTHKPNIAYDYNRGFQAGQEDIAESADVNSLKFLKSLFLICPECDKDAYIDKIEKEYFIVVCSCTKWKISFQIKEH